MRFAAVVIAIGVVHALAGPAHGDEISTHTVVIVGEEESDGTWYRIGASERLEQISGELDGHQVTVNHNDTLRGTGARGFAGSSKDGYRVWGDIVELELEDENAATIYVDGEVYPPEDNAGYVSGAAAALQRPGGSLTRRPGFDRSRRGAMRPSGMSSGEEALVDCLVRQRRGEDVSGSGCPDGDTGSGSGAPQVVIKPAYKPLEALPRVTKSGGDGKGDKGHETMDTTPDIGFAPGQPSYSDVSGRGGAIKQRFEFGQRPLNRIGWREKSNKPCQINMVSKIEGEQVWARTIHRCGDDREFACEGRICKADTIMLDERHKVELIGRRTAITRLRVCTNGKRNGRIKGIEVSGREILNNGAMSSKFSTSSDTLPNCSEWKPLVICPADAAATGLTAHFDRGRGLSRKVSQLVGLQLVCRRVVRK